jgi:hypothetical protein
LIDTHDTPVKTLVNRSDVESEVQIDPFHVMASGWVTVVPAFPTALQNEVETQEIRLNLFGTSPMFGLGIIAQVLPFQRTEKV